MLQMGAKHSILDWRESLKTRHTRITAWLIARITARLIAHPTARLPSGSKGCVDRVSRTDARRTGPGWERVEPGLPVGGDRGAVGGTGCVL